MPVGNGFMFRARREQDAEAFLDEWRRRHRPRRSGRRQRLMGLAAVALVVGWWVLWALLG